MTDPLYSSPNAYYVLYYAVLLACIVITVGIPTIIGVLLWKKCIN